MARQYALTLSGTTTTLTSNATKTLILLNPATVGFKIIEVGISLDNVTTNAEPVRFDLYRVSTLGSPSGTTLAGTATDEAYEAAQTTALINLTAEPSAVTVFKYWLIQPNSGLFVLQSPLGREFGAKGTGARIGLRYTTVANVTPACAAYIEWEE